MEAGFWFGGEHTDTAHSHTHDPLPKEKGSSVVVFIYILPFFLFKICCVFNWIRFYKKKIKKLKEKYI